jgi:hypothetical protein
MKFLRPVEGGCRTDQLRKKLEIFPLHGKFTKYRDKWKIYSQEGWTGFALLFKPTDIVHLVGTQTNKMVGGRVTILEAETGNSPNP